MRNLYRAFSSGRKNTSEIRIERIFWGSGFKGSVLEREKKGVYYVGPSGSGAPSLSNRKADTTEMNMTFGISGVSGARNTVVALVKGNGSKMAVLVIAIPKIVQRIANQPILLPS